VPDFSSADILCSTSWGDFTTVSDDLRFDITFPFVFDNDGDDDFNDPFFKEDEEPPTPFFKEEEELAADELDGVLET